MRRAIAISIVALAVAAPAAHAWTPDMSSARAYAERRAGDVTFAVRTPGRAYGHRARTPVRSASVVKAMLMVAYLNHRTVRGRALRRSDLKLLSPMVRWSNNIAATRVRNFVGNSALAALARRAGMRRFRTAVSWGSSVIDASDQTKLFLRIDRLVVSRHRATAMRLLSRDRAVAAMGHRPRPARRAGRSTSRAAGGTATARSTTRWRCCAVAGTVWPWRS